MMYFMISESAYLFGDTIGVVRPVLGVACSRNMSCDPKSNLRRAIRRNSENVAYLLGTQESADTLLLDVAIVLLEGIGQVESNDWEARHVIRAGLGLFVEIVLVLSMNVGDADI